MWKRSVLGIILWYQRKISPLFPSCCRFTPSCSAYAYEAISRFGLWRGGKLALCRFLRCHPFHKDRFMKVDPVPQGDESEEKGKK